LEAVAHVLDLCADERFKRLEDEVSL